MSTEVEKFDVTEHIRQKVRQVLISSIPDEQMDVMIKAEYDKFFSTDQWKNSPFRTLVYNELEKAIKGQISKWIDTNFERVWTGDSERFVGDAIAELTPIVQQKLIMDITQQALFELQNRMR